MDLNSAKTVAFVHVSDRERALSFYRDTLGLTLASSDPFGDMFAVGGALVRMTALPDHQAHGHPVLGWEVADMDEAVDSLVARGVAFEIYEGFGQDAKGIWNAPDGSAKVAWFKDPDGNMLSLSQNVQEPTP